MFCPSTDILSAYHDGELDTIAANSVRSHLAACPRCQAELARMAQLSAAIAADAEALAIRPLELARVQAGLLRTTRQADLRRVIYHTAAPLAVMAASILIIASAWLMDLQNAGASRQRSPQVAAVPDWERLASTLHAEPRPGLAHDGSPYSVRYAAAVDWMLRNHGAEGVANDPAD